MPTKFIYHFVKNVLSFQGNLSIAGKDSYNQPETSSFEIVWMSISQSPPSSITEIPDSPDFIIL